MKPRSEMVGLVVVVVTALMATPAWAIGPGRAGTESTIRGDARLFLSQFGVLPVVPLDPAQSFVEGYEAYRAHDPLKAIERMTFAADKYPALADYALFFLASAQRDSGDNQSSAATFRRLSYSYPQSVFADEASLQYAEIEFKLGQPGYAQAASAALIARNPAAGIDQRARLLEARAMLARGDVQGAYGRLQGLREKYPQESADGEAR